MRHLAVALVAACNGAPAATLRNTATSQPEQDPRRELTAEELTPVELHATHDDIKRRLAGHWIGRAYDPRSHRATPVLMRLELGADGRFAKSIERPPQEPCEVAGRWRLEAQTPELVEIVLQYERHCAVEHTTYSYAATILRLEDTLFVFEIGPTGGLEGYRRDR